MKYVSIILLTAIFFASCKELPKGANGIVYKNPAEYNDYIIDRQSTVIKNIMAFSRTAKTNLDSAKSLLSKYEIETDSLIVDLKGMPDYKGDSTLRNAAVNLFGFYKTIFGRAYKEMIDIRLSGGDETAIQTIVERISREQEGLDKSFQNAQKAFVKKNKMELKENEMQKEIDKLNQ